MPNLNLIQLCLILSNHRKPNKFSALLYGHLYAMLNTELFSDELKDMINGSKNLLKFYSAIESRYYNGS